MIDAGLLASLAILVIVPTVFVHPWPSSAAEAGLLDTASGAMIVGILVGRLVAVGIDDPSSLTSLSDLVVLRSGVEFWPGAAAGITWLAFLARRDEVAPARRLAAITSPALVAWACFEATCLLRDGCPGPASPIGLRPRGLETRMLPVGLIVAVAATAAAIMLRRLHRRGTSDLEVVTLTIAAVAAIRSVASIWLPHIGTRLTRQHQTSIAVLIASSTLFVVLRARMSRVPDTAGA